MTRRERARLVLALEARCPRCAAAREAGGHTCLECGFALPARSGALALLRRRWISRLGWYPGDAVFAVLAAGLVATAGAASALELGRWRAGSHPGTIVIATTAPLAPAAPAGWPAGQSDWTVVLASLPAGGDDRAASTLARQALRDGLTQVRVLDSSRFASLLPGYAVVVSGVYGSLADAQTALRSVQVRGFAGAYTTFVAA